MFGKQNLGLILITLIMLPGSYYISTYFKNRKAKPKQEAVNYTLEEAQKLAEKGDPEAQFQLGMRFQFGEEVDTDKTKADSWFRKSAGQGYYKGIKAVRKYRTY